MVAANILNKMSWAAGKWCFSSFEVRCGARNSPPKLPAGYEMLNRASNKDGFFGTT
jgi:hypothetical protein